MTLVLIGLTIGLIMGLTGAGGGVLAVPALVGLLGWGMQQSAPVALIAVASGALVGTVDGLRSGLTRYRAALLIALMGLPFTTLGQHLAQRLPESWLKLLFAGVLLLVAYRLISQLMRHNSDEAQAEINLSRPTQINPLTQRFVWTPRTAIIMSSMGIAVGFVSGLLGVGGGFILVPLLLRLTPLSIQACVATSLMVLALVSSGAVISALMMMGLSLPMPETLWFAVATIVGMLLARLLAKRLAAEFIQWGFAALLVLVAAMMLFKLFV